MSLFHWKCSSNVLWSTREYTARIDGETGEQENKIDEIKWSTPTTHTHNYGLLKTIRVEMDLANELQRTK